MTSSPTAQIGVLNSSDSARSGTAPPRSCTRVLARDNIIRLEQPSGITRIEIKTGVVWITGTPADGDILLRAGDVFEFQKSWPYVLQALELSEFSCA